MKVEYINIPTREYAGVGTIAATADNMMVSEVDTVVENKLVEIIEKVISYIKENKDDIKEILKFSLKMAGVCSYLYIMLILSIILFG